MVEQFKPCVIIPTYNNPETITSVVEGVRQTIENIVVVDDGSDEQGRLVTEKLAQQGLAAVIHRAVNGGKGAAVLDGFRWAERSGYTHALQIDADGQHEVADIPKFLETARNDPHALISGRPIFDETAPKSRKIGRMISQFWVNLEMGGSILKDPLCGFRVYPVQAALSAGVKSLRMGFDPEIAVKMYWNGSPIVNVDTHVRYLSKEEGGVSHFHMFWDNLEISRTHSRLCQRAAFRLPLRWIRWGRS